MVCSVTTKGEAAMTGRAKSIRQLHGLCEYSVSRRWMAQIIKRKESVTAHLHACIHDYETYHVVSWIKPFLYTPLN